MITLACGKYSGVSLVEKPISVTVGGQAVNAVSFLSSTKKMHDVVEDIV